MAMEPMVGPRAVVTLALETDDKLIAADSGWHRQALRPSRALATGLRRRSQSRKPATIMVMSQRPMAMERRRPISPPARPEESRVGKECVSQCRYRWALI